MPLDTSVDRRVFFGFGGSDGVVVFEEFDFRPKKSWIKRRCLLDAFVGRADILSEWQGTF